MKPDKGKKTAGIGITVDDINKHIVGGMVNRGSDITVTEFSPYNSGKIRIDAYQFNRWNKQAIGYEIKLSRTDFLNDKKWEKYLKYCTKFYFVAPKGIIKKEELPNKIGLVEVWLRENPRWAGNEEMAYRFKLHELENDNYVSILEGLLIKIAWNKNIL